MNLARMFSFTFLGVVLLASIFFSAIINFVIDYWWFQEVKFTNIFLGSIRYQLLAGGAVFSTALVFLLINFLIATSAKNPWFTTLPPALVGQTMTLTDKIVKRVGLAITLVIAIALGVIMSFSWTTVVHYLFATPFGTTDPIFGQDISFYVFTLPFYSLALGVLKILIILALIGCGLVYLLRGSLSLTQFLPKIKGLPMHKTTDTKARVHLGLLLSLFLLATAGSTYLAKYSLLTNQAGVVSGAGFTDTTLMIPLLTISAYVYVFTALMALFYGISGKLKPLFAAIILSLLVGLTIALLPPLFQRFIVAPNELAKETPFIKHSIAATREAYGLKHVEEKQIAADQQLTAEDIAENNLTIKNVRLWDRDPLLSTFSQIQEIRTYYEFPSVDNDRYMIDGEQRQIMLSARELSSDSLPNKNWINEHLTFTHGYGITAGPVNQVTPEGLPVLFVKDLPPKADIKELEVTQPQIYFGEMVNDYVIVKTNSKEFDYPKGEENVYTIYEGTGGVQVDTPLKRLLFAAHFGSMKMLLSNDITGESRILYNRDIAARVQKIAPFLTFDHDPYLVVADGKLYWMIDAYTTSHSYPYSKQVRFNNQTINYIRNSVKVAMNAYDGSTTLYLADTTDPIIKTYAKVFPDAFKPLTSMPESLASHIRYPEDIFTIQTNIYTTYHMDDPQIFYNKEDQWEIPAIAQSGTQQAADIPPMAPRHMIMKLPGEQKEEFILMLPFTPRAKDNLSAWMVARNDNGMYGKIAVYSFPKDKLVFGPKQIIGRINQDPRVSQQIALWDQRGSQVIQGPLLVIPIEQSLIYIRPLYLKAEAGKIPELKRVIVAYENKIAMEETLEEGLNRIFGTETDQQTEKKTEEQTTLAPRSPEGEVGLQQAQEAYERALNAQRNGDWATYGEQINQLGDILQQLTQ